MNTAPGTAQCTNNATCPVHPTCDGGCPTPAGKAYGDPFAGATPETAERYTREQIVVLAESITVACNELRNIAEHLERITAERDEARDALAAQQEATRMETKRLAAQRDAWHETTDGARSQRDEARNEAVRLARGVEALHNRLSSDIRANARPVNHAEWVRDQLNQILNDR